MNSHAAFTSWADADTAWKRELLSALYVFEIPMDDLCAKQPAFLVEKAKKRGGFSPKQKELEEALPTPPSIRTESLRPRNLLVRWFRDRESGEYRYEIDVVE